MDRNKEKELRDVLIKHLRNAGIHVVTDQKEGQSVLNDAGFTTKMQSRLGQLKDAVDFIRKKLKLASSGQTPIQVTEWVHKKTENILGHRIMEHLIDVSGLNHAYNNHGVGGKKLTPNDIPLTKQDIELAPYILMNPDKIERGTPNSGRESIIYEKTLSNGRIIYIEAEEGLDGQSLVSKNMWANIDPRKLSPFKVADARSEERPHVSTSDNVILDDDRAKIIKDAETAIKNEEILARADKLFVFSDKTIYGFVKNDTIYIDTNELNIETPIHEYAHLWAEALRQQNTDEWKNVVSIMKSRTELWNKVKEDYPHLETDDEIADEVLATYSGQHGMQRLREECRNYKDGDTVLNRISAALDHFWENMSHFFGIQYKSAEEVADRVFYDLMNEVNPLVYTKKGVQKFSDRMILGHKNIEQTEHNKTEGETSELSVVTPQVKEKTDIEQNKFLNYVIHGDRRYPVYQNLEARLNACMKAFKVDIPLSNTLYGTNSKSGRWSDLHQAASRAVESILRASGNGDEKLINSTTTDYVSDKAKNLAKDIVWAIYNDEESNKIRREEALKAIGYPYKHNLGADGSFNIPTVDKSLYWDYAAGLITLKDAAREFNRCGWTNFIDEKFTMKRFGEINKELGKLDADLKPLSNQPKYENKKEDPGLREARSYLKDVISHALAEMNGHIEIAHTEISSITPKGDWKNEGNGHVFLEVIKGEHNIGDAKFHDVHAEQYTLDEVISKLDYSETYILTTAIREAQIANLIGDGKEIVFKNGFPVSQEHQSIDKDYIDRVAVEDGELNIVGHRLDVGGKSLAFDHGHMMYLDGIDELYTEVSLRQHLTQDAKQAIHDRIINTWQRSFTPDQIDVLNRYHQVAAPDKPASEVFKELLHEVVQEADVASKPEKWVTDTAKELKSLAEGITHEQSQGLRR